MSKTEKAIKKILEAVKYLNWTVAVPKSTKPDDNVLGLIIGEGKYVNSILNALDKAKWTWKDTVEPKSKTKLKCQDCGSTDKTVEKTVCPYASEINNDNTPVTLCGECYKKRAWEI